MITTASVRKNHPQSVTIMKARRACGRFRARGGPGFYDAVASATWVTAGAEVVA
jgi:hypothetical protein